MKIGGFTVLRSFETGGGGTLEACEWGKFIQGIGKDVPRAQRGPPENGKHHEKSPYLSPYIWGHKWVISSPRIP